jgi:Ni/Co efflux regulator RcnB/Tfp pilus assembly protein PilN
LSDTAIGGLVLNALIGTIALIVSIAVLVIVILILIRVSSASRRSIKDAADFTAASTSARSKSTQDLADENRRLQTETEKYLQRQSQLEQQVAKAEQRAAAAERVTAEEIRLGLSSASQANIKRLEEEIRGLEGHNLSLHEESAGLRAQLAKLARANADRAKNASELRTPESGPGEDENRPALTPPPARAPATAPSKEPTSPEKKPEQKTKELPPAPPLAPPIKTRTIRTATTGVGVFDDENKTWTSQEDTILLDAYLTTRQVPATAERLRVDQKQVALRLTALLLRPHGKIDDASAPKRGKSYSAKDLESIPQAWRDGRKLAAIARDHERDQLGIGWKLLDDPSRPVELTAGMVADIVDEVHR